jgi:hypothetical protein
VECGFSVWGEWQAGGLRALPAAGDRHAQAGPAAEAAGQQQGAHPANEPRAGPGKR